MHEVSVAPLKKKKVWPHLFTICGILVPYSGFKPVPPAL